MIRKFATILKCLLICLASCTGPESMDVQSLPIRTVFPQSGNCEAVWRSPQILALFDEDDRTLYNMDTSWATLLVFDPIPINSLTVSILNGVYSAGSNQWCNLAKDISMSINESIPWKIKLRESVVPQSYTLDLPPNTILHSLKIKAGEGYATPESGFNLAVVSIGELRIYASTSDTVQNLSFSPLDFFKAIEGPASARIVDLPTYAEHEEGTAHRTSAELEALRPVRLIQEQPAKFYQLFDSTGITRAQVDQWSEIIRKRGRLAASADCMELEAVDLVVPGTDEVKYPAATKCPEWLGEEAVNAKLRDAMRGVSDGARSDTFAHRVLLGDGGMPRQHLTVIYKLTKYDPQAFRSSVIQEQILVWDEKGMLKYQINLATGEEYYARRKPQTEPVESLQVMEYFHSGTQLDSVQTLSIEYSYMYENQSHYLTRDFRTDW